MIASESESNSKTVNDNRRKIIIKKFRQEMRVRKALTCIHLFEDKVLGTFHFRDIQTDNYLDCEHDFPIEAICCL